MNVRALIFLAGLLVTGVACRTGPERLSFPESPPPTVLTYQRTTYDVCPNYFLALEILKKTLHCSPSDPAQSLPSDDPKVQRCQRALRGCNVCAMLAEGTGPGLDWGEGDCDGQYKEKTGSIRLCNDLCYRETPTHMGSSLLHESIHHCQHEGHGEVANECQAYQAEEACFGAPFPAEAGICFPIP